MKYIDFFKKKVQLHQEMCEAITELMTEHGVKEVDLLGSNASHTYFCVLPDDADSPDELEANRVYLDDDNHLFVDTPDIELSDNIFYLRDNKEIVLCSIDSIYYSVYEVLEQGK